MSESEEQYTIIYKIQKTIYGDVYKAYDNLLRRPIALKLSRVRETCERGENPVGEIAILETLASSNNWKGKRYVIHLHDSFQAKIDGLLYNCTVLEYADGGDLLDKILTLSKRKQRLSFAQIRIYFVMLAEGLKFIHQHGVSHLDLSLENILLRNNELRISDFGQAQTKRTIHDDDLRRGKLKYMSPEVYRLQEYDGFKADVWSLGVILWQMITFTIIYHKPSVNDPRFALLTKGVEGIQSLLQQDKILDVPTELVDLLSKMLNVKARNRFLIDDVLQHPWITDSKSKTDSKSENCSLPRLSAPQLDDSSSTFYSLSSSSSSSSNMCTSVSEENFRDEVAKAVGVLP